MWMWLEGMKLQMPSMSVAEREVQNTDITNSQREKILGPWCCKNSACLSFYFTTDLVYFYVWKALLSVFLSLQCPICKKRYHPRVILISLSTFSPSMVTIHFITGKIPAHSMPDWLFFNAVAFLRERRRDWGKKRGEEREKEKTI